MSKGLASHAIQKLPHITTMQFLPYLKFEDLVAARPQSYHEMQLAWTSFKMENILKDVSSAQEWVGDEPVERSLMKSRISRGQEETPRSKY